MPTLLSSLVRRRFFFKIKFKKFEKEEKSQIVRVGKYWACIQNYGQKKIVLMNYLLLKFENEIIWVRRKISTRVKNTEFEKLFSCVLFFWKVDRIMNTISVEKFVISLSRKYAFFCWWNNYNTFFFKWLQPKISQNPIYFIQKRKIHLFLSISYVIFLQIFFCKSRYFVLRK